MDARNRSIPEWLTRLRTGQVRLPRFQRHEAWAHQEVGALLEAVLRNLPSGAVLILEVGDKEPFISRSVSGAPTPVDRCTEHLLDGQQRLTALWRSLTDDYPDRTWLVRKVADEEHDGAPTWSVEGQSRWERGGKRFPVWVDDPKELWARGLIPARLLRPDDMSKQIREWTDAATEKDLAAARDLGELITEMRTKVATYNIPYLSLPVQTPRDVALDVFIKLNTTSVRLTAFDIVVAQLEAAKEESLHDLIAALHQQVPNAAAYRDVGTWVLDVAALSQDRATTQASYTRLDLPKLLTDWDGIVAGIGFAVEILEEERVFDADRLPTVAVLPVLAALRREIPASADAQGHARAILRAYVWRAFLTRRYESSAGTRALQDFRALRTAIQAKTPIYDLHLQAPIFDEVEYPLPNGEVLMQAGWPKNKEILARGILALSLRAGGRDLADDEPATRVSVRRREYHHLFPDSVLTAGAKLPSVRSFRALNCALISWRTNRVISAKDPIEYLRDRVNGTSLGVDAVSDRLRSHLVPYEQLAVGWSTISDAEKPTAIAADYEGFLNARAEVLLPVLNKLANGFAPSGST